MATSDFTKRLAYQGMLLNVSNRLSSDNLRNLKYLVKDDLPADKLEDATQGTVLFTLLQQQDLINSEKLGLLSQLLEMIDRKDLVKVVEDYENGLSEVKDGKIRTEDDLSPQKLKAIGEEVGKDWRMLGRYLLLKEPEIQAIDHAYPKDLHEAALQVLLKWKDKSGDKATPKVLKQALTDLKLMNIVHKYF